jgi:hypothetical protein
MKETHRGAESSIQSTRRTLLKVLGGTGIGIGSAGFASAQDGNSGDTQSGTDHQQTGTDQQGGSRDHGKSSGNQRLILLGGQVSGWQGKLPESIRGDRNPSLELRSGVKYKISWVNLDGARHQFQILDANGNVLEETQTDKQRGITRSITFTATRKMKRYRCKYHPQSMHGKVRERS